MRLCVTPFVQHRQARNCSKMLQRASKGSGWCRVVATRPTLKELLTQPEVELRVPQRSMRGIVSSQRRVTSGLGLIPVVFGLGFFGCDWPELSASRLIGDGLGRLAPRRPRKGIWHTPCR
jgi:hypothetical protein